MLKLDKLSEIILWVFLLYLIFIYVYGVDWEIFQLCFKELGVIQLDNSEIRVFLFEFKVNEVLNKVEM